MKVRTKGLLLIAFMGLFSQPLFAQEAIFKEMMEGKKDRKYAFYPSTLRMIDLSDNPHYDEMVNGIDKLLIFTLDSVTQVDRTYMDLTPKFLAEGFEEYAMAFGGNLYMAILGKEGGRKNYYTGYVANQELAVAFFLKGEIAWQKIPTLLQTMNENSLIDLFDIKALNLD